MRIILFKLILVFYVFQFSSCGLLKNSNQVNKISIHELSIKENGFEGNIVVNVNNDEGNPILNYLCILSLDGERIFDFVQPGPKSTFFELGEDITIEVIKDGYLNAKTVSFSPDSTMELATVIDIILIEKK